MSYDYSPGYGVPGIPNATCGVPHTFIPAVEPQNCYVPTSFPWWQVPPAPPAAGGQISTLVWPDYATTERIAALEARCERLERQVKRLRRRRYARRLDTAQAPE